MKVLVAVVVVTIPAVLAYSSLHLPRAQGGCDVSNSDKQDCGVVGTTQQQCEATGCCWQPVSNTGKVAAL